MINSIAKHKYVLYMTLIAMLWCVLSNYFIQLCCPQHYLSIYPSIPIYFYLLSMGCYLLIDSFKNKSRSHVMIFLGSKLLKILLSVVVLLIYVFFVKVQVIDFLIVFLANYLFFLIIDTILMSMYKPNKEAFNNEDTDNETLDK